MEQKKKGFISMIKDSLKKTGGCCGGDGCCGSSKENDQKSLPKEDSEKQKK